MARYTGNHCPVCERAFTEGDDIVVCPDCGTPYHRECWKKVGACLHKSEHAAGFEWKPDAVPEDEAAAAQHLAVCPNCGTHNTPGAVRCSHCGVPLNESGQPQPAARPLYTQDPAQAAQNAQQAAAQAYRTTLNPDDLIDGIKAKDWAAFVGHSALYYLMQFFRLSDRNQKTAFSFSAFILGPIYCFYRKMWKQGILVGLAELALSVPAALYLLQAFNSSAFGTSPAWLDYAMTACDIALWVLKFAVGMFAVVWYKRTAKQRIDRVAAAMPEGDARTQALMDQGGTSVLSVILYMGVTALIEVAFMYLAGPAFVRYIMTGFGLSL